MSNVNDDEWETLLFADESEYADTSSPVGPVTDYEASLVASGWPKLQRDPLGFIYDHALIKSDGETIYTRSHAQGTAGGPAQWSSEHDCNPICGCHLASKCRGCNACMNCDGCYCNED